MTTSSWVTDTRRWLRAVPVAALLTMVYASSASAILFTFTGTTGDPKHGTALFTVNSSTSLTMVVTNTAGPGQLGVIGSVLDGIAFTFSAAPTSLTLTSVTAANGVVNLCSGPQCPPPALLGPLYGWAVGGSLSTPQVFAGGGSWHPGGIINDNVTPTDGITNAQHNPYLDGPVTFQFTVAGWAGLPTLPTITTATGYFGTAGVNVVGTSTDTSVVIPEPTTLLLLGSGLFGLPLLRRRRGQRG